MNRMLRTVGLGLACVLAPRARCAAQGTPGQVVLTRRQAIDTALARNPQLRIAEAQVAQARARVTEATAFPDPTISYDRNGENSLTQPGTNAGSDLGLGLTIPFPTKFLLRGRIGNADVHAAQFALLLLQQQLASQAAQAYDALLVALRHRMDLQLGDTLAKDFLRKTQLQYERGAVARLDVVKAQVVVAQAENDLIGSDRALATARAALNRLLGRTLGGGIEVSDSLGVPAALPDLDAMLATARTARPELRGLASQRLGAASSTSLARSFWLPDVSVGLTKNMSQANPSTYTTGIGFSVPLFFWNHTRGEVAESQHHEAELTAALLDLEARVDLDVRTAYASADAALRQAVFIRDQVLPAAQEAYRIASVSYGLGGSSALDVLDARRTLLDAKSQYVDALGAANDAAADLERAVGAPQGRTASGGIRDR